MDHEGSRTMGIDRSNGGGRVDDFDDRADDLLRRASALRQHCEQLRERLDALARSMPDHAGPPPPDASEGIRLVAMNLALGGATREEVDARLRETFEVTDIDALLEETFAAAQQTGRARRRWFSGKR